MFNIQTTNLISQYVTLNNFKHNSLVYDKIINLLSNTYVTTLKDTLNKCETIHELTCSLLPSDTSDVIVDSIKKCKDIILYIISIVDGNINYFIPLLTEVEYSQLEFWLKVYSVNNETTV